MEKLSFSAFPAWFVWRFRWNSWNPATSGYFPLTKTLSIAAWGPWGAALLAPITCAAVIVSFLTAARAARCMCMCVCENINWYLAMRCSAVWNTSELVVYKFKQFNFWFDKICVFGILVCWGQPKKKSDVQRTHTDRVNADGKNAHTHTNAINWSVCVVLYCWKESKQASTRIRQNTKRIYT